MMIWCILALVALGIAGATRAVIQRRASIQSPVPKCQVPDGGHAGAPDWIGQGGNAAAGGPAAQRRQCTEGKARAKARLAEMWQELKLYPSEAGERADVPAHAADTMEREDDKFKWHQLCPLVFGKDADDSDLTAELRAVFEEHAARATGRVDVEARYPDRVSRVLNRGGIPTEPFNEELRFASDLPWDRVLQGNWVVEGGSALAALTSYLCSTQRIGAQGSPGSAL